MKKRKKILISGATGFTGSFVVNRFLECKDDYEISIFARNEKKVREMGFDKKDSTIYYGSFEEPSTLKSALEGKDIYINVASLGFGHAPDVIDACKNANVKRTVFFSTTSIFTQLNPASKAIRLEAEQCIRDSGLAYTIIRPTMIFGTPEDRNIYRLIRYVKKWPCIFIPGPGTYLMQPVYVGDLADAVFKIAETKTTIGKEYNLSGRDALSYNELIKTIAKVIGKNIMLIHIPLWLMKPPFWLYEKISKNPKIKVEQLLRLNEDKNFDHSDATNDFGYHPLGFKVVIHNY